MAGTLVSAAARGVGDLATKEASFLCGVHNEVEFLREDLRSLQTFLSVASEAQRGSDVDVVAADSVRRIRDAAYEADNIVDAADYRAKKNSRRKGLLGAMSRYARKPRDLVAIHRLGKDILRVRRKIQSSREVLDTITVAGRVTARAQEPSVHRASLSRPTAGRDDVAVVGLEGDIERIEEWLKDSGNTQLTVISIVAMGGAGKTTLARKVYSSAVVKAHFDAFAFVSVSQQFQALYVLKEITKQAMGIKTKDREFDKICQSDELEKMGEQELAEMLHNFLQGKRYLIVLDDVWRTNIWDVIKHALPDLGKGSRVMLTTRNSHVANQADKLTHVHEVRLLNEKQSWELFSLKSFPSYVNIDANNRHELESVGRNLAKKCNGLPLALVVLGSHLSKNLHRDTWLRMDRCLDWEDTSNWVNMERIIARSYVDMPSHYLKSCFLYIASWPENFRIGADRLAGSWIAEGFVPYRTNHTLEQTAHDYLEELVQRSMVQVVYMDDIEERNSVVQMHDILRKWAIQHAQIEGFLKVCKNHGDVSDRMSAYRSSFLNFFDERICITAPNMRSMLGFYLPTVTLGTLRFLRVLYMFDSNMEKVSEVIGRLIHLRYIGLIRCKNVVLSSSIGQLLNLQSIVLTGTDIPYVPESLWDIPTLRHVELFKVEEFAPTTIRAEEHSELQTLYINGGGYNVKMRTRSKGWIRLRRSLMHMTQLRTLQIYAYDFLPVDVLSSLLSSHRHLNCLGLSVWESMTPFPDISLLAQNLRYLCLSFPDPWNTWHADLFPTLGRLQSLVHLSLWARYRQEDTEDTDGLSISQRSQNAGYEATILSSPASGFPRLQYLTLGGVQAKKLRFVAGTMPKLVELRLHFGHMTTVPDGLFDLPSLKKLELCEMEHELPRETHELLESKGIRVIISEKR